MPRSLVFSLSRVLAVAALIGFAAEASWSAAANPFQTLAGSWRGRGNVSPVGGTPELVSCRVGYQVSGGGASVVQTINCAGADYRISAEGRLTVTSGDVTGTWSESTYNVGGSVRGTAKGNGVYVRISSDRFNGRMVINVASAGSHSVHITQFDPGTGKYTTLADMTLAR